MRAARGFTLVELMISVVIMLIAVLMASSVLLAGTNLARNSTNLLEQSDQARIALGQIAKDVQLAGNGAPNGVYVDMAGVAKLYGPIFGLDGTSGAGVPVGGTAAPVNPSGDHSWETDDLWLVVPTSNAMGESCVASGAYTTITTGSGAGPLKVRCTASFSVGDLLLASNMSTGALLTVSALTAPPGPTQPGVVAFSEQSVGNFNDAPDHGGFQQGDMLYKVQLVHYYVRKDTDGVPTLYRAANGSVLGTALSTSSYPDSPYPGAGRPFVDVDTGMRLQRNVDDLQVAYGYDTSLSGNPSTYTWTNGLPPDVRDASSAVLSPGVAQLRAVRVSVVVRSRQTVLDNTDKTVKSTAQTQVPVVENHYAVVTRPPPDGYRRVVYTRIIELPNLAPGSL